MLHEIILDGRHVSDIFHTFSKRESSCFAAVLDSKGLIDYKDVCAMYKKLPPFAATACIKTFVNGWTTASRMSEPEVAMCRLGCTPCERKLASHSFYDDAKDKTSHYLACLPLWRLRREWVTHARTS